MDKQVDEESEQQPLREQQHDVEDWNETFASINLEFLEPVSPNQLYSPPFFLNPQSDA